LSKPTLSVACTAGGAPLPWRRRLALGSALALLALSQAPAPGASAESSVKSPKGTPAISLYHPGVTSYYAFLEQAAVVRSQPDRVAQPVERLSTLTADGTSMLVEVLAQGVARDGSIWLEVHLPVLPNSLTGWLPRSTLGPLVAVHTWLIVDTKRLRATLIAKGRTVFSVPIGAGKGSTPTPHGSFYIIDRLISGEEGGVYGPLAFGTSAKSAVLTDWPGGGVVGIHGTDQPQLIPGRPSHGCIRMRNGDIARLGRLMPVGTPVTIR
jgi:lipoprotein-anchoring transpeptidase ErfK/SrfK